MEVMHTHSPAESKPVSHTWLQRVCPAPRRYVAELVTRFGLSSGLDIGCGENSLLAPLRPRGLFSVGLDASAECIRSARDRGLHDDYICGDIRAFPLDSVSPRPDVVVASHVIEHLSREEGFELLVRVEQLAGRLVYVETPYGFVEPGHYTGGAFERHRSGWFPWDFEARGYTVFGSGVRRLRESGLPGGFIRWVDRLCQWAIFRRPGWAGTIAAIRYCDADGRIRPL